MFKNYHAVDIIIMFFITCIGAAEISHIYGVFMHRSLSACIPVFLGMVLVFALAAIVFAFFTMRKKKETTAKGSITSGWIVLMAIMVLLVVSQTLFLLFQTKELIRGDMTVETVNSFLGTNAIYSVNPMTGSAYTDGIPSRIKVLCLPTMYAFLANLLGIKATTLVWRVVPVVVLLMGYAAYESMANSLFGEDRDKKVLFMTAVSVLIWAGAYATGLEGNSVLFAGWTGTAIRNFVLMPYTISLCIRRKYLGVLLCVAAEACITWTLYGMGACLVVAAGILVIQLFRKPKEA